MTPTELHALIRKSCIPLLATAALHPEAIARQLHASTADVNEALHYDWSTFRQVAGTDCFLWTLATNAIALAAQREVVAVYAPLAYEPMQHNSRHVGHSGKALAPVGQLTATSAIGRALLAIGSGTVEQLAEAAGCEPSTIQQQAARFSDYLNCTKELVKGEKRRRWRITSISLKAPIGETK